VQLQMLTSDGFLAANLTRRMSQTGRQPDFSARQRPKRSRRRRCARVDHEKERRHRDSRFASNPPPSQAAGRGH